MLIKNCAPFIDCVSEINNTKTDNSRDTDIVKPMYNLIKYNNDYLKHLEFFGSTIEMNSF